jgi:hypothetical protein
MDTEDDRKHSSSSSASSAPSDDRNASASDASNAREPEIVGENALHASQSLMQEQQLPTTEVQAAHDDIYHGIHHFTIDQELSTLMTTFRNEVWRDFMEDSVRKLGLEGIFR